MLQLKTKAKDSGGLGFSSSAEGAWLAIWSYGKEPLALCGPQVPSSINGENRTRCPARSLPLTNVPHAVFLRLKSCTRAAAISLKPSLTLAVGAFFMLLLSETSSCSCHLRGATSHQQSSYEVNDSANKKLLVIRRLDVQALLLF